MEERSKYLMPKFFSTPTGYIFNVDNVEFVVILSCQDSK